MNKIPMTEKQIEKAGRILASAFISLALGGGFSACLKSPPVWGIFGFVILSVMASWSLLVIWTLE